MRARWTDPANWRDVRFAAILTVTAGLAAAVPPAGVVAAVLGFAQSRPLLGIIGLVVAVGSAPYAWRVFGPVAVRFLRSVDGGPHQRNLTIFADGEADRSPCGSGTSARLTLLHDEGRLGPGQVLRHDSIVGTTFLGRVVEESADGVITEVEGAAYRTGTAIFTLDPRDPVGTGFSLR